MRAASRRLHSFAAATLRQLYKVGAVEACICSRNCQMLSYTPRWPAFLQERC
jgi:hypothetical protein